VVERALETVARRGLGHDAYEFQMLLGVGGDLRRRLVAAGHRLRVYVPYGRSWYAYSLRRLKENPAIAGHALRGLLKRGR
jgi:proline dehydrogenase